MIFVKMQSKYDDPQPKAAPSTATPKERVELVCLVRNTPLVCLSKNIVTEACPSLVYVLHLQFVGSNRRFCWDHWKCSVPPKVIPVEIVSSLRFNGCHVLLAEHLQMYGAFLFTRIYIKSTLLGCINS